MHQCHNIDILHRMSCKEAVGKIIEQIINLVEQIPSEDYNRSLAVYENATLGKHFRHIYEFFDCILEQCDCGELDYSQRKREASIENSASVAKEHFISLLDRMNCLDENQSLQVYTDFSDDGVRHAVSTSVGREIMYAYDHAVHHLAIVRIGVQSLSADITMDSTLGIAASTIKHDYKLAPDHA